MGILGQMKEELKYEIIGIALIALGVLGLLSILVPSSGLVSVCIDRVFKSIAGEGRYLFPLLLAMGGARLVLKRRSTTTVSERMYGALLLFLLILTFCHLIIPVDDSFKAGWNGDGGGLLGAVFSYILRKSFGIVGTYIILAAAGIIALLLLTNLSLATLTKGFASGLWSGVKSSLQGLDNFFFTKVEEDKEAPANAPVIIDNTEEPFPTGAPPAGLKERAGNEQNIPMISDYDSKKEVVNPDRPEAGPGEEAKEDEELDALFNKDFSGDLGAYKLPPLTILSRPLKAKNIRLSKDINENIRILEETLESFGVKAKVMQVSRGPAITRYEIQPPAGVKVSRIVSLADDIALSMAAPDVRIEAPIPGKAAVGIEVPNKEISMVHIRDLLETQEFGQAKSKLTVVFGKDIAGNPIVSDLAKMPHLLIAGATGSGKSVCLNTLIASILFKATPDEVKFLMIDPKMVELATYNGIPHLASPVVTDPRKAATSLRWAAREMERRYTLFASVGVRDITRYNTVIRTKDPGGAQPLPFMVVIIDELADLMIVAPADVEDAICRLAQMARAAGIHLVVATQRPSVDVITGLIKANIPSRVSFAVSSQIDSRTILDMGGAEKLLGKGDMLFFPVGASKPVRVQGAFLSDREVDDLVNYLKKQAEPVYDDKILVETPAEEPAPEIEDELLAQAVLILIESGHASISMLQRRLHIGYARAARLIDIMEKRGIVGGYEGSKPRAILMSLEQYQQVFKKR
ncbi:DNA translocase SpoIIIE [Pelotomaculum schinkii]|uniref:DNA translocase SpoIIIE n=1 Tax=Pelotomaculum schinkii TaxID=78350 RepID=A0A4Y7RCM8_9FIRM|nr:DNA translocase FtsK [Pelotomaculum schinkii]TEB06775.1 DNA translocase SpoIIIE [Pelotomaculum schinkii]